MREIKIGLLTAFTLAALAASSAAKPPHKQALADYYGPRLAKSLQSCNTCHLTDDEIVARLDEIDASEEKPWNRFGRRLADLGKELAAGDEGRPVLLAPRLRTVAGEDADGDGVANELELLAGTSPGNAEETPAGESLAAAEAERKAFATSLPDYQWRPFDPVERPAIPQVARADWVRNPVDAFIAAEHERRGLRPRPEAEKHILLRRVSIDLTGLPPTREALHDFVNDESPEAYQKVVERLLASPRYGERWGRHWMDIWRYSDWAGWGKQIRDSQPHIWRWRDWIIESLNADRGYDEMVRLMLAADEMPLDDPADLRATGFVARNFKLLSREQWLNEAVDYTSRALLGVTLKCAQCHDHMYDLVSQEEYYKFRAIFEPHKVRLDRVAGELDVNQDGLARVYDAELDAKTFFYIRGDERTPDKDRPMSPGAPRLLGGGDLACEPVSLALADYYPALRPMVTEALIAQAKATVAAAEVALMKANEAAEAAAKDVQKVAPATGPEDIVLEVLDRDLHVKQIENPAGAPEIERPEAKDNKVDERERKLNSARGAVAIAEKKLATAQAELASFEARVAAEAAKYEATPDADAQSLAAAAGKAERLAAVARADHALLEAEAGLAAAKAAQKPDDENTKKAVEEAQKKVDAAKKQLEDVTSSAEKEALVYPALGAVYPKTSTGRRLALARWITSRENPLAARVAVNHVWARRFGRGIVATVDDFGQNGSPASHPALLDWLAAELMEPSIPTGSETPWSLKHIHRLMVMSNTYRMASTDDAECQEADPENVYLWRAPARRLEAELVRDAVLWVSGELDLTAGGPELDCSLGMTSRRRSIYFRNAPEKQMTFLQIFDMAAPSECYQRRDSVMPQQALALANSELTVIKSRVLARRLAEEADDNAAFVHAAFEQVLSRSPTQEERDACLGFLEQQIEYFQNNLAAAAATSDRNDPGKPSADPPLRSRENLVHVLLNHNDFVTVR